MSKIPYRDVIVNNAVWSKRNAKIQEHYEAWEEYCFFKNPINGGLYTKEDYEEHCYREQCIAEHEMEMEAENAWLRHAENQVDYGFEQWEHSRLYS